MGLNFRRFHSTRAKLVGATSYSQRVDVAPYKAKSQSSLPCVCKWIYFIVANWLPISMILLIKKCDHVWGTSNYPTKLWSWLHWIGSSLIQNFHNGGLCKLSCQVQDKSWDAKVVGGQGEDCILFKWSYMDHICPPNSVNYDGTHNDVCNMNNYKNWDTWTIELFFGSILTLQNKPST